MAMLAVCGFVWAVVSAAGSWQVSVKARIGALVTVTVPCLPRRERHGRTG
ncbi:DUF6112 family protein [Promicromonospora vindobonensis]|uniref:DUF6112 family protein n=1 Tax=Promicromonospora vindobonensis TaxID=195748 RepID=A0ABW5VYG3_9MICO